MSHLDVLAETVCDHLVLVLGLDHDGHTLLRLADRKLCRVESVVLHWHTVKIDIETFGKLADSHADTAGTEVV